VASLKQLHSALEPHLGDRTETVLKEGLARLGLKEGDLSDKDAANLLKRYVYRELQREMDAAAARKVVKGVLASLGGAAADGPDPKAFLQEALSRFNLYFEWPEVQRLRSLAALVKASESEGQPITGLLKEARDQIALLDEKLQNALLRQARDISDLEDALERVKSIGGPKLRRLQSLLKQIKEAQTADTLATAEVERARKLAADMRKLIESSVVQNPTLVPEAQPQPENSLIDLEGEPEAAEGDGFELLIDFESLEPEVADRIREIDLAEERRRYERLREQYASVWDAEGVTELRTAVEERLDKGELAGEKLSQLQLALDDAAKDALAEARARYEWLSERLRSLDLEGGLSTGRARSQLELIKESLDMGVLPGDLEEAERQIHALEEALAKQKTEEARRARVLEEAEGFVKNAKEALKDEDLPEIAGFRERLALLETGLAAGEVDEALLGRLKAELPEVLNQIALAGEAAKVQRARLIADLESLPPFETIKSAAATLRLQVDELSPEELEKAIAELRQQALELSRGELEELARLATSYGVDTSAIDAAKAELAKGKFADLENLRRQVEAAVAAKRQQSKQALEGLAAAAKRLEGMGGEKLLAEIAAATKQLDERTPDLAALKAELDALLQKREELRRELGERYQAVRERFEKSRSVGGETAYKTQALISFLDRGAGRLDRLGTGGLIEFERALGEAEKLVAALEEEYAAAKQVAEQLQDTNLDDLLGVFDASPAAEAPQEQTPSPAPAPAKEGPAEAAARQEVGDDGLGPFRIRGVLWAHLITPQTTSNPDVNVELIKALSEDLEMLRQELGTGGGRATVITLPEHVLLVSPFQQGQLVLLAERALLSRLVALVNRHLQQAS